MSTKLIVIFLLVGLVPLTSSSILSLLKSSSTISKMAYGQLEGVREIKKAQITRFFEERQGDMGVLVETVGTLQRDAFEKLNAVQEIKKAQISDYFNAMRSQLNLLKDDPYAKKALVELNKAFKDGGDTINTALWRSLAKKYDVRFKNIMEGNDWYDIFLIHKDGDIVYTVSREPDLGMTIPKSKLKDQGIGIAFEKVLKAGPDEIVFSDLAPYSPSGGVPAGFMMAQMRDNSDRLIGVVAFQIPMDKINEIMLRRKGLGETGESYMVGQDKLMRSDSYLDPEGHSVTASFKDQNKVDTEGVRQALAGNKDQKVIIDYNDNPVLSAWDSIDMGSGIKWAILTEIDVAEAFCPKDLEGEYLFKKYTQLYGYYDLFLINPDGYCFYTVAQEADYHTNFENGIYAESGLGKLFRKVKAGKSYGMADFSPYAPSNNEPAAFIAQPVVNHGNLQLVVALQLSIDAINTIMQQREGMGKTGETYLVGSDKLMRSDSYLDPVNHTVKASFANPSTGKVDTEAADSALSGKTESKIITDYNGNPVLSAFTPVTLGETTWALIAEIDKSEAFASIKTLKLVSGLIALIGAAIIVVIAFFITRAIVKPVKNVTDVLTELSQGEGDLTTRLPVLTKDEIGQLAERFNDFMDKLHQMISDIVQGIGTLSSSSSQMSSIAEDMSSSSNQTFEKANTVSAAAEEMTASMNAIAAAMEQSSTNVSTVASGAEEMNSTINEIARNAENARDVTRRAVEKANESTELMNELSGAANTIGKVVETITDISEQVNLLSLNATIEAARAGKAGKGFAVVANEIKDLAKQTSDASMDIKEKIESIQNRSQGSLKSIEDISNVITDINDIVSAIATSVEEQSSATNEIAANISQASDGIEEVNTNVNQSSAVTMEISKDISEVNQSSKEIAERSGEVKQSSDDLAKLATKLNTMVGQFTI